MKNNLILSILKEQKGVIAIIVGVFFFFVILGIAAFAIDIGYRHVARNELQNAADAGALAGARMLYNEETTLINVNANQIAYEAARENKSAGKIVELKNHLAQTGVDDENEDVQRGHWSFGLGDLPRGFYCNPNNASVTTPVDIAGVDAVTLDEDELNINAVKVVTRREASPIKTFFANIFGIEEIKIKAESVAYIGFLGDIGPDEVDQPIAICLQSIWNDKDGDDEIDPEEEINCSYGRMLNSGANPNDHNTGGWTNFTTPCETASTTSMRAIFSNCLDGNPDQIDLGEEIGTTGGVVDSLINHPTDPNLMDCWKNACWEYDDDDNCVQYVDGDDADDLPEYPWSVTLPMINCTGNNVGNCSEVLGAVNINIVWILEKENKIDDDAPYQMFNPETGVMETFSGTGAERWDDFVTTFNLQTVESDPPDNIQYATVANDGFKRKSIYFLPDCTPAVSAGSTGGTNFGIRAKIPVIVNIPFKDDLKAGS